MAVYKTGAKVRQVTQADAASLCEILNEIIMIGGTTALETPMSVSDFAEHYVNGPDCVTCFVAESGNTEPFGFQMLVRSAELAMGWADIGTFTKRESRNTGVGAALFARTKKAASDFGILAINATVRADNRSGLLYYEKMGFITYKIVEAVPLKDGTLVDRIHKKYSLDGIK